MRQSRNQGFAKLPFSTMYTKFPWKIQNSASCVNNFIKKQNSTKPHPVIFRLSAFSASKYTSFCYEQLSTKPEDKLTSTKKDSPRFFLFFFTLKNDNGTWDSSLLNMTFVFLVKSRFYNVSEKRGLITFFLVYQVFFTWKTFESINTPLHIA